MAKPKQQEAIDLKQWAPLIGTWKFNGNEAEYSAPQDPAFPIGISLATERLKRGSIKLHAELLEARNSAARILFGFHAGTGAYFTAGIGGMTEAYVIDEFLPGKGLRAIKAVGSNANLQKNRKYEIEIKLQGQSVQVVVDGIVVVEATLPHPLVGEQVGLFAWGQTKVLFHEPSVLRANPRVFVIMQFAEPFNSLYTEIIKPITDKLGFEAFRADDLFRPGIILQDIIHSLVESDVVVAEVTPANPNVFYELGYAHAIEKPTVLLAERQTDPTKHLPFDISGFRVIFYDNTIRGKRDVETHLRKHLENIKNGRLDSVP